MRSSVEEEKVEMSKLGGILLRMPRPITSLETSWNVPGVTILPPPRFYIYIYIYRFPLTFAQHLCVDLVKRIRYGEDEMNKGWLEKIFERSEPKMETFKKG